MVRTRATTVPEPVVRAVGRGGGAMRGRGRGRGRKPTRGRGQAAGPTRERAAIPPPADEVAREDVVVVDEQTNDEEALPQPTPEMIHQVLTYLNGLSDQGQAPLAPQVQVLEHAVVVVLRMDASLGTHIFPRLTTGPVMTSDQHDLFVKFLKLKPPVFRGTEFENAYDFLVDCHELLHMMDVVERFGVEFVTYQLQGDAKIWWRSYVECQPAEAPPMTWAAFSNLFTEKYIPQTLRDKKRDEFLNIEQGKMSVTAYEAKFCALSRYDTQLCFSPEERIRHFVKGLRSDLQILALQVATTAKSFQEVVDFMIQVEGVKPDDFTKTTTFKKLHKRGEFSGSYSRGQGSGGYAARPIQSSLQVSNGVSPGTSQPLPNFRGYVQSSSSSQRSTLDPKTCYECGEIGHIRSYCSRQSQTWYDQGYRGPTARGRGSHGRGCHSGGRGGQGRGSHQSDRGSGKVGNTNTQSGRGNGQIGDRAHCYAFPGRPEAEASDTVIAVQRVFQRLRLALGSSQSSAHWILGLKESEYQDLNIIPLQHHSLQKMKAKTCTGVEDERDIESQVMSENGSDIESQPSKTGLSLNGSNLSYWEECQILCQAAMKDEWSLAKPILDKKPSFVRQVISKQGETMLHLATAARSTRFLRKLINLMGKNDLALKNSEGNTAFFTAAAIGSVEIAKEMSTENPDLPNIHGEDGILPIMIAALYGYKDMVSYLFGITNLDVLPQEERLLLQATTQCEMYVVALNIFRGDKQLASQILQGNVGVLNILAHKSLAISNQVVACSLWRKFTNRISMATRQFIPCILCKRNILKQQAGLLLEELWAECKRSSAGELLEVVKKEFLLHSAARAGNVEFLAVIFRNYPNLIWQVDDQNWTIFHVAVLYRQEKVFSLIRQLGAIKNILVQMFDNDGNSILHLAGKLGKPIHKKRAGQSVSPATQTNVILQQLFEGPRYITERQSLEKEEKIMLPSFLKVSGAALQMQRERLWFKEVEKIVPSSLRKLRNNDGKTARELFTEEHKLLLKEGESWMKHTAHSCMLVATLIATIVFAAGFTVPGGNNNDNGIPVLLKLNGFTIFVISDAVALFSSIVSIIMFLSILTSRYAEDDFLVSLPVKLLFGLTTLFVSIVGMLLAFAATFFLAYRNYTDWEPNLIAACVSVPVALLVILQYLWLDVVKSTCSSMCLFKPGNQRLY